ncbi:MAG: GNAT family N-acetyltransferase [Syntrophobacteraceae bacterium]
MSIRNLSYFTRPSSVALLGASGRQGTVGQVLTRNLLTCGFAGKVYLVNPNYTRIGDEVCFPDVASLPSSPDLAVIATPRESVPGLIDELGKRGAKAAVVITAGFGEGGDEEGKRTCARMLDAARPYLLRIIGPNCLGIMVPGSSLNASMGHIVRPVAGSIALVAQSGAVQTSVLDWAATRGIGFSCFISLGDMADVDFGDMLDYLAEDFKTRSILLYMETVTECRKFMSAARAAARVKPVIVVKAGRTREGALAAARHTGAVAGNDAVYDAAFRRAGMLRVHEMQALFDAVETLAMMPHRITGDRLTILTNGGGVGVMATDVVIERDGHLAELSPLTMKRLDAILPSTWSRGNPVDIMSDGSAQRYALAVEAILDDDQVDALLVLNCPIAVVSGTDAAIAVAETYKKRLDRPKTPILLTSWLGEETAAEARRIFSEHRIPSYKTPTDAVRAFMHMVRYQKNQQMLMETPPSMSEVFSPDVASALGIIEEVLLDGREWLTEPEVRAVLGAYSIPTAPPSTSTASTNASATERIPAPSPGDLIDWSKWRICSADSSTTPRSHQLMIKVVSDEHFGPVILFGHGGEYAEEIQDSAVALPPLNLHLAKEVMSRTRVYDLLKGSSATPRFDIDGIALTLVKVSQLICDIAEIHELEINPLTADEFRIMASEVRIRVAPSRVAASERLAIRPYPKELEDLVRIQDGQLVKIRPIRPEDEPGFLRMVESLSPEERRMRFLHPVQEMPRHEAARLTQIDYDREMALVLASPDRSEGGEQELYGSVRIIADSENERAEYAILVRSDMGGKGLGKMLMQRIIDYARSRGIREISGQVLSDNIPMLRVCEKLGFTSKRDREDPGVVIVTLKL